MRTRRGDFIQADHLVVCPGIDLEFSAIDGFDAFAQRSVLHAWQAGAQTLALRRRLSSRMEGYSLFRFHLHHIDVLLGHTRGLPLWQITLKSTSRNPRLLF